MMIFFLATLAILGMQAAAQENTVDYWMERANEFDNNGSFDKAISAYDQALENINQSIEEDPKDSEAWWLKAECLERLGRSEAALEAYEEVASLNGSKALGAWIRKADVLARLGRYNESLEAFDGALGLLPTKDKQSAYTELWDEDTTICYSAWLADGQILRISSAWFNRTCGDFENIILFNSERIAAWQRRVPEAPTPPQGGKWEAQGEALVSRGADWEMIWLPNCCGDGCQGWS
jgi:tetratricopeptide (TPR) repeat protein